MPDSNQTIERQLREEILFARQRVYKAGRPTPLEQVAIEHPFQLFLKREDLSPIRAYKWRGAYNRMALLTDAERASGVVTASAGNHAQGVALAAQLLKTTATIFMPRSTPKVKQNAVQQLGGDQVTVRLSGDSYDNAVTAALADSQTTQKPYIHAYDDLQVMAGQGTLADEIVMSGQGPFDIAFLQIGGGGMAAAVACWLKTYYPNIKIVGVEGIGQASMQAAVRAGRPVRLESLDIFCDGTAVRQAGELTFELCKTLIDEYISVSNDEICAAMDFLWNQHRCISEPAGAMGIAAVLQKASILKGQKILTVLCGANIDFSQLGAIASTTTANPDRCRYVRVEIPEKPGAMLKLLDECLRDVDIIDFQYGKTHLEKAWPIFGIVADATTLESIENMLRQQHLNYKLIAADDDIQFRMIPYRDELMHHPLFLKLEFYERPGALHDFMHQHVRGRANFCYFNYRYSGERVGRALIGFEFDAPEHQQQFIETLPAHGDGYRQCKIVSRDALNRITGLTMA